jgi:hypothetical protein
MSCACAITAEEAAVELDGLQLVSVLAGSLDYIKEVRDKCLAEGIPVLLAAPSPGRG